MKEFKITIYTTRIQKPFDVQTLYKKLCQNYIGLPAEELIQERIFVLLQKSSKFKSFFILHVELFVMLKNAIFSLMSKLNLH